MLIFNSTTNIFDSDNVGVNALVTKLLPFQFQAQGGLISEFKLINGTQEIDLTDDIGLIDILEGETASYYVFDGTTELSTSISCGSWQISILLDSSSTMYYSNFFNVINSYNALLTYFNVKDFDDRIYQYGYKNFLYIDTLIVSDDVFKTEDVVEIGDGSKQYEYQNFAESYYFNVFGDINMVNEFNKLPMFDSVYFTWQQYSYTKIFDRAEFEASFDAELLNYKGVVKFSINPVEKTLCETNKILTVTVGTVGRTIDGETTRTTDDGTTLRITN